MKWLINLVARMAGVTPFISRLSPLLLSLSALLAAVSHILGQAGTMTNPSDILSLIKGLASSADGAVILLAVAGLKKHFNHESNAKRIDAIEEKSKDGP